MNLLRGYIREMLSEKQVRDQKKKRVLYHIGPRPAKPMPMSRPYAQSWRRYWLDQGVESGVFFSPNPIDIAQYHGISGDVYAYKIPEWVIAKAGGIHRYDHGSEVLISSDVWQEAGNEIEFLGKSMREKELWEEIESLGAEPLRRSAGSRPGWMSDDEWERSSANKAIQSHISGLRFTKHLKNAIRMMKPNERAEALAAFETIDAPGKKDYEIIDMIKSYMNETALRGYIREALDMAPRIQPESQIFCDMDGVLVNFESAVVNLVNQALDGGVLDGVAITSKGHRKRLRAIINKLGPEWRAKNRSDLNIKVIRNFMMGIIGSNPGPVFAGMLPHQDALSALWPFLTSSNLTVNILSAPITARAGATSTAASGKTDWVNNYLRPPPVEIIITPAKLKADYAITDGIPNILIDDKASTIDSWNAAGGLGILHIPGESLRTIKILKELGL